MNQQRFHVIWEHDFYANSAEEAALMALKLQRTPQNGATYFHVLDQDGVRQAVDLEKVEEDVSASSLKEEEMALALVPDHPAECDGTDFVMRPEVTGVWISVDGASVHICRGSAPRAGDGGVRVYVYGKGAEDDPLAEIQLTPEEIYQNASFVIFAKSEASDAADGTDGYWSNTDGWSSLANATPFSFQEKQTMNLPVSAGMDAVWVLSP